MKGLLLVLIFAVLKQNCILADDLCLQNTVKQLLKKIEELRKDVDNIIEIGDDLQKDYFPTDLNEDISFELERHPVVLETQEYLKSSQASQDDLKKCKTLYDSKYNTLKTEIYQKLHKNMTDYYAGIKEVLTTRFEKELKEWERRVNNLYKSPDDLDFLKKKIHEASKVLSDIEIAQHKIILTNLDYFNAEDSAQLIYDSLFVPFTECLNSLIIGCEISQ